MATKDNARRWTADTFLPKPTNPASSLHASNSFNGLGSGGGPGGAHSSLDVIRELDDKEHSDLAFLDPRNGHHTLIDSNSSSSSGSSSGSNNSSSDDNDDDDDDEEHEGEEEEEGEEEDEDGDCSDNEHEQQSADDDDMEEVDMEDHSQAQEDNSHGTNESSLASSSTDASATTNSGNSKKSKRRESISAAGGTSSTTPARKFTKKVKKVKTKSSKGSKAISDEAKLEAAKPVVDRFLELENPDINGKPVFLFMIPGMMMYVISRITRYTALDHSNKDEAAPEHDDSAMTGIEVQDPIAEFMQHVEKCRRQRDYADMEIMKRSYMTMKFLIRNDVYHEFLISQFHIDLVKALFDVFKPESDGNFYHFQKVFEMILRKYRVNTMDTIFATTDPATGEPIKPLVLEMLPFLDQPPVASVMMQILFPSGGIALSLMAKKMGEYYQLLRQERFVEKLLALTTLLEEPSQGFGEFMVAVLDEGVRHRDAKALFADLADEPVWAERLVDGACSKSPVQQRGCVEILYSILVRSIQVPFQDMFANNIFITERSFGRVEAHLENVANAYAVHLVPHIPKLCELFVGTRESGKKVALSGYKVERSFTVARLWLLDSIYHCLGNSKDDPKILESIPAQFWANLVDNFIQFRFNNAYHVQFYKLFRLALWSDSKVVYDRFFIDTNLVSRLIMHYRLGETEPTGSKGYIILILNCLRLSADVEQLPPMKRRQLQQSRKGDGSEDVSMRSPNAEGEGGNAPGYHLRPNNFWSQYLQNHADWQVFHDTLREATLVQTKDTMCDMDRSLRFQFAPLQARQPNESPLTKKHFGIPGVSATGQDGIDLGSQYSNSLGFGVPMIYEAPVEETPSASSREDTFTSASKGLSEVMNSMNWKLIPPQRVLNAMKKAATTGNSSNNSTSNGSSGGVILLPPPSSGAANDGTNSAASKTGGKKGVSPGPAEASPNVGTTSTTVGNDASADTNTTKTKKKGKKKKNKKKNKQQQPGSEHAATNAAVGEPEVRDSAVKGEERGEIQSHSSSTSGPRLVSSNSGSDKNRKEEEKKKASRHEREDGDDDGDGRDDHYDEIEIEIENAHEHMHGHEQEEQQQEAEDRNRRQGAHDSSRTRPSPSSQLSSSLSSSSGTPIDPEAQGRGMNEEQARLVKQREKRKRKKQAQQQRKKLANLEANNGGGNPAGG